MISILSSISFSYFSSFYFNKQLFKHIVVYKMFITIIIIVANVIVVYIVAIFYETQKLYTNFILLMFPTRKREINIQNIEHVC